MILTYKLENNILNSKYLSPLKGIVSTGLFQLVLVSY